MSIGDLIQALVALLTMAGLLLTAWYSQKSLRASRQATVTTIFLSLSQRLQETLYDLIERDNNILKETDPERLRPHMSRFFTLFDIFSDLYQMRPILEEFDRGLWLRSEARIRQLMRKKAVQQLWAKQVRKNAEIFDPAFRHYMTRLIDEAPTEVHNQP